MLLCKTGFECDQCQVGYYGIATVGTPYDCTQCPCYEPRVYNATCTKLNGTLTCLYCNPGYVGILCDS